MRRYMYKVKEKEEEEVAFGYGAYALLTNILEWSTVRT